MSTQKSILSGLVSAIEADPELGPRWKEIEALEAEVKAATEHVMLEIAYSPVIMREGGTTRDAVEVAYKSADGRYVFDNPYKVVTADELKVMRARYLITRGKEMSPAIDRAFRRK